MFLNSLKMKLPPALCLLLVVIIGCREDNALQGFDLLTAPNGQRAVDTTTVRVLVEATFQDTLTATGSSIFLDLGQIDNVQSRALLRFKAVPDSIDISKVTLILDTNTIIAQGQTKSRFLASVHRVTSDWEESTVTSEDFGDAFELAALGEAEIVSTGAVVTGFDTLSTESIRFEFNQDGVDLVSDWADTTLPDNFGILIDFDDAEFVKEFIAGNSAFNQPRLEIVGLKSNGEQDTVLTVVDEDAFLAREMSELPGGPLYIDNVFSWQTVLQFDLSEIPRESTINEAILEIDVDKSVTQVKSSGFSIRIDLLSAPYVPPTSFKIDSTFFPFAALVVPTTGTMTTVLTSLVQFWVTGEIENNGIILRAVNPGSDVTRVALHSGQSNPGRGPRLKLKFSSSSID